MNFSNFYCSLRFAPAVLSRRRDHDGLLLDLGYATCTNCAATFADCEAKTIFHSDWLDESY